MAQFDLILVGGGLSNSLLAYRLASARPGVSLLLLERDKRLGGNHTWSFHGTDVTEAQQAWLAPLVARGWDGYEVRFPDLARRLTTPYLSITSDRLHAVVAGTLGDAVRTSTPVGAVHPDHVVLESGERLGARAVIDGRGPADSRHLTLGYQKFLGQEVRLSAPHGLGQPILMDATVEQVGGYRFVYVLPFDETRLLIEDTYYTDGPALDDDALRGRIAAYAEANGWAIDTVIREERGVLPILLGGDMDAFWNEKTPGLPAVGLRGGFFHATTGYSLPDAVRTADLVAGLRDLRAQAVHAAVRTRATRHWKRQGFYRLLNRMLFRAAAPEARYKVLERFYRMPQRRIERFYAGRSTMVDKLRLLAGKPPVPLGAAFRALRDRDAGAAGRKAEA